MNPRIMSLKMKEVRNAQQKGKGFKIPYLSKDEKDFLKLYKKMKAPRDEIIQLMKQADLRKFIIEKYTADCPFCNDCPWCKMERKKEDLNVKTTQAADNSG